MAAQLWNFTPNVVSSTDLPDSGRYQTQPIRLLHIKGTHEVLLFILFSIISVVAFCSRFLFSRVLQV